MRRLPRFAVCTVLLLTPAAQHTAASADAPAKLKTQLVKLKLAADQPARGRAPAIELVQLPPGKVTLKSADRREHEHQLKPIWIARYETRWDEYDVFWRALDLTREQAERQRFGDGTFADEVRFLEAWYGSRTKPPYWPPPEGGPDFSSGHDGFPANCVHFRAALKYCAWLSKHTGKRFRLPTEAEWEYACRAGGPPLKPDAKALDRVAWVEGNAGDKPHAVGQKEPNAWGLYDMLGNVGEFVVRDPKDDKGLLAGGSYKDEAANVHSAAREPYSPHWQLNDPDDPKSSDWLNWTVHHVGFRVVMED